MKRVSDFQEKKSKSEKISMVTCYDYTNALILNKTKVDCLLVGDSLAMTMHGFEDTISATIDMMALHVAAVSRAAKDKFIIGDLPFLAYRGSLDQNMSAVQKLMQAGAHAVKLEGATGNIDLVHHLVHSGVPVMGHLGLTPQFVHQLGGYKVQGKTPDAADRLLEEAIALENAGCFALVLECVPDAVAEKISKALRVPTIGIGAGAKTDGQVLVFQDMLGLNTEFKPKFVKQFLNGAELISDAINTYVEEVETGEFPADEHLYKSKKVAATA